MQRQHDILNRVSELVNAGTIRTTLAEHFGRIDAANLRRAHALIESGHDIGIRFEVLDVRRRQVRLEGFGFRTTRAQRWARRTSR